MAAMVGKGIEMKVRKRKLEACNNCGMFGMTTISWSRRWVIHCDNCRASFSSRFLQLAIWRWNSVRRKWLKDQEVKK